MYSLRKKIQRIPNNVAIKQNKEECGEVEPVALFHRTMLKLIFKMHGRKTCTRHKKRHQAILRTVFTCRYASTILHVFINVNNRIRNHSNMRKNRNN